MALILHGACPGVAHAHSHGHGHSHDSGHSHSNGHLKYDDQRINANGFLKPSAFNDVKNGYRNLSMDPLLNDSTTPMSELGSSVSSRGIVGGPRNKIGANPTRSSSLMNGDYSMKEIGTGGDGPSMSNPSISQVFEDESFIQSEMMPKKFIQPPEVSTEQSINVRAAAIHVLGDLIQSAGVFIASVIIKIYPEAKIVDPLCTFVFSVIVMCTTLKILKEAITVLMEGVPPQVRYESVLAALRGIPGVRTVHSLHIWSLTNQHNILTVHLAIDQYTDSDNTLKHALYIVRNKFRIDSATVQVERYNEEAMLDCVQCSANTDT